MAEKKELTAYQKLAGEAAMGFEPAKQLKQDIDAITLNKAEKSQENGAGKGNPNFIEEQQRKVRDYYAEKALNGGREAIKEGAADARVEIHNRKIDAHNARLESDPDYAERVRKAGQQLAQAMKFEGDAGQSTTKSDSGLAIRKGAER